MTIPRKNKAGPKGIVLVLGNGQFPPLRRLNGVLKSAVRIVCCDGAADKALRAGIVPDVVVGDLDSISPAAKKKIGNIVSVKRQDMTDLEKAMAWCRENGLGRNRFVLAGFTGGRSDFTLYNLHLLKRFADRDVTLIDDFFRIFPARNGTALSGLAEGTLVSLVPLERTTGVTTQGLKWDLKNAVLEPGGLESASNRVRKNPARLRYKKGFLLWFVSDDKHL